MAPIVSKYLAALQGSMAGCDPALVQDALDDAENHLRTEIGAGQGAGEAIHAYGTPE